jgi:hypothetical protein
MPVNPDFRDLFSELNGADVRFLLDVESLKRVRPTGSS